MALKDKVFGVGVDVLVVEEVFESAHTSVRVIVPVTVRTYRLTGTRRLFIW